MPERGRRAHPLAQRLAGDGDEHDDDEDVGQHLQEERQGVVLEERVGEPEQRLGGPWMSMIIRRIAAKR